MSNKNAAQSELTAPAKRALAEAKARRLANDKTEQADLPKEVNAKRPAEPTRYGDWETKGIASDF